MNKLKIVLPLFALLIALQCMAQTKFDLTQFAASLTKIIAAKRDNFKPFLKKDLQETNETSFVPLIAGAENTLKFRDALPSYVCDASVTLETSDLPFTYKAFKEMVQKAYLPNEAIVLSVEGEPTNTGFDLRVIERDYKAYNLNGDIFTFSTTKDMATGKPVLFFRIVIYAQKRLNTIFSYSAFVNSFSTIVRERKNAFANLRKGPGIKDEDEEELAWACAVPNDDSGRIIQTMNKDSTEKETEFSGRFRYALPANKKIGINDLKQLITDIYKPATYDLLIEDTIFEGNILSAATFRVVELQKQGFYMERDRFDYMVESSNEDWFSGIVNIISFRINILHETGKKEAKKFFNYWARGALAKSDSLKTIVGKLISLMGEEKFEQLKAVKVDQSNMQPADSILTGYCEDIYQLPLFRTKEFSFQTCPTGSQVMVTKKLGNNPGSHAKDLKLFIEQIGNALPAQFIYKKEFYHEFMLPANGSSVLLKKMASDSKPWVFLETKDYRTEEPNLLMVYMGYHIVKDRKGQPAYYLTADISR